MAIRIKQAPAESVEQLVGKVPHEVYDLPLDRITQDHGLDGVTLSGWRFLHEVAPGQFCVNEVEISEDGDYKCKRPESGNEINDFAAVYDSAHLHEAVQKNHYEIAYLRVPYCDVMAIWLRGDDHHHEFMIPLTTIPPYLKARESYPAREFMHIVEHIARERIMQEDMHIIIDDLPRIEGIGPKIAELLIQVGICTFARLAETDSARLSKVLQDGGSQYNLSDATTWPEQAKLAAEGQWDDLEKLQDKLKGGKR